MGFERSPPRGVESDFWGLGGSSAVFRNVLASLVSWKAENAFCHNALTRRIDPHAAETPITSKNMFFAFLFFAFFSSLPKAALAKHQFLVPCISTDPSSEKSRTPPDRSATPYYVESFQFQPGFMERNFKISKVLSQTLP